MKKIFIILVALASVFTLVACSSQSSVRFKKMYIDGRELSSQVTPMNPEISMSTNRSRIQLLEDQTEQEESEGISVSPKVEAGSFIFVPLEEKNDFIKLVIELDNPEDKKISYFKLKATDKSGKAVNVTLKADIGHGETEDFVLDGKRTIGWTSQSQRSGAYLISIDNLDINVDYVTLEITEIVCEGEPKILLEEASKESKVVAIFMVSTNVSLERDIEINENGLKVEVLITDILGVIESVDVELLVPSPEGTGREITLKKEKIEQSVDVFFAFSDISEMTDHEKFFIKLRTNLKEDLSALDDVEKMIIDSEVFKRGLVKIYDRQGLKEDDRALDPILYINKPLKATVSFNLSENVLEIGYSVHYSQGTGLVDIGDSNKLKIVLIDTDTGEEILNLFDNAIFIIPNTGGPILSMTVISESNMRPETYNYIKHADTFFKEEKSVTMKVILLDSLNKEIRTLIDSEATLDKLGAFRHYIGYSD